LLKEGAEYSDRFPEKYSGPIKPKEMFHRLRMGK